MRNPLTPGNITSFTAGAAGLRGEAFKDAKHFLRWRGQVQSLYPRSLTFWGFGHLLPRRFSSKLPARPLFLQSSYCQGSEIPYSENINNTLVVQCQNADAQVGHLDILIYFSFVLFFAFIFPPKKFSSWKLRKCLYFSPQKCSSWKLRKYY